MGDPKNLKSIPTSLPPGFCFHPTDEQVFCYYLSNKNNIIKNHGLYLPSTSDAEDPVLGFNVVPEIDLYSYDPCNLPDVACFPFGPGGSRKHWYCFVKAVSEREKRKAMGGFWYRKGRARDVVGGKEGSLLGTMRTFVFYRQNSKRTVKAEWVMYEYDPVDHPEEYFVLCRVFFKSRPGNKILEHVPSSFADKNVAVVHGPGIEIPYKRHDGASASGVGEIVVHGDMSVDTDNEIQRLSMKLISEPENPVVAQQASDDDFQFTVVVPQPDNLVRSSSGIIRGSTVFGGAVVDELITDSVILEGDFIELNDLISPLPNIDSVG